MSHDASSANSGSDNWTLQELLPLVKEGQTLQEIGDHFGITRERVRQILAARPQVQAMWRRRREARKAAERDARRQEQAQVQERRLEAYRKANKRCLVCLGLVMREADTCSQECADLWVAARYRLDADKQEQRRLASIRYILSHQDTSSPTQIRWAKRAKRGLVQRREFHWADSHATEAMKRIEALRARNSRSEHVR